MPNLGSPVSQPPVRIVELSLQCGLHDLTVIWGYFGVRTRIPRDVNLFFDRVYGCSRGISLFSKLPRRGTPRLTFVRLVETTVVVGADVLSFSAIFLEWFGLSFRNNGLAELSHRRIVVLFGCLAVSPQ